MKTSFQRTIHRKDAEPITVATVDGGIEFEVPVGAVLTLQESRKVKDALEAAGNKLERKHAL